MYNVRDYVKEAQITLQKGFKVTNSDNQPNLTRLLAVGGVLLFDPKNRQPTPAQVILPAQAYPTHNSFEIAHGYAFALIEETDLHVRSGLFLFGGEETNQGAIISQTAFIPYWDLVNNPNIIKEKALEPYNTKKTMTPQGIQWAFKAVANPHTSIGYAHIPKDAIQPLSGILRMLAGKDWKHRTEEVTWQGIDRGAPLKERLDRSTYWGSIEMPYPYIDTTRQLGTASLEGALAQYNTPRRPPVSLRERAA